jgi:radical SAM superfamily enzyme YgiQ (UPF0313 family)
MSFEQPLIRPPSEWRSGLIRVTRGCNWNRCRFCGIYPHLGEPDFSIRTLPEIFDDIAFLKERRPDIETIFLGDADPLQIGTTMASALAERLREAFPLLKRLTSYARVSTLKKIGRAGILQLAAAGLNRIHLGLESGSDEVLRYHRKGQSTKMIQEVAGWLRDAHIELSVYVLLGMGGAELWRQHALATAELLNDIVPAFIRVRRLWIYPASPVGPGCPLLPEIHAGRFLPQTAEGSVVELQLLLQHLTSEGSFFTCDHENNYVQVQGRLQKDLPGMLEHINAFLLQPDEVRERHYNAINSRI